MKKTFLMAAGAVAAVATATAATTAQAVDVELYGQVNKAVMAVDDGVETATHFVDNDKSSTRVGLKGEQMLDNGLTASVLFEFSSESNSSSSVEGSGATGSGSDDATSSKGTLEERHSRVGLAGDFGAVFLGHTSTATDGIAEIDMAGASNVMGSYVGRFGGGVNFTAAGVSTTTNVSDVATNFDGISTSTTDRTSVIRYNSPVFNGFQASAAAAQGGTADIALRYSGKVDAFQVKGGIGYVSNNEAGSTYENTMAGSVSVKHDNGLAGTLSYGTASREGTGDDPSNLYVKVGYAWDAFEIAADMSQTDELNDATNSELTAYGLAGQYNMGSGVSVAAMYRTFDLEDNTATNFDEINVFTAGLRVKF